MEYALQTHGLTKSYRGIHVVSNVSLNVKKGDIYGFVGKNGAGKTTLIRLVLGIAKPSEGSFTLLSESNPNNARKKTGSLIESPALYTNMNAEENLELYCTMLDTDKKCVKEILETVGLEKTGRKKAKNFSLGMKQRLGIAMALIGDPELIILDEPINGLDPVGVVEVRELLLKLNRQYGKTIFVSSHILGELEKIATRYGIISKGRLVEEISAEDVLKSCKEQILIKTDNSERTVKLIREKFKLQSVEITSDDTIIIGDNIPEPNALSKELFEAGITISGLSRVQNNIEDYFIRKMEEG